MTETTGTADDGETSGAEASRAKGSRAEASGAEASGFDRDVVVVGGGPAGCSVGVFTARYGLDTVVFDRGNSSIRRCGYLENYLGFPAGIDIDTLCDLFHDHAEEAGCAVVADMVESVERLESDADEDAAGGFRIETAEGRSLTAARVVAAARYDGEFLRSLDDGSMFETHEHDGENHEHFDRDYPNSDGTTPVEGVYVATPADPAEAQAISSAGRGAVVARTLIADVRRERGYPDAVATHYDWVRREAELSDEWADRDRWAEWFDERVPADHPVDGERLDALREREIDRKLGAYVPDDELDRRAERGQRRLLDHLDDDLILEAAREIAGDDADDALTSRGD